MSIFLPYDISDCVSYFSAFMSVDLTSATSFEKIIILLFSNLYFFAFWFILIYFSLKVFNRIWERIF